MGQRLNIEIISNGQTQANAYYHWSGYTSSAIQLTSMVVENAPKVQHDLPAIRAVRLLEVTGAHLTEDEVKEANRLAPSENFVLANSRNDGLVAITNKGIEETRDWEETRVEVNLDDETVNFSVVWVDDKDYYLEEYEKEEADYEKIPLVSYEFDDISFADFPRFAEEIFAIIEKGHYHVRLEDGDVVNFIE